MRDLPNRTLEDKVRHTHLFTAYKHGLDHPHGEATRMVDEMTNSELLAAISDALGEVLAEMAAGS